MPTTSVEMSNAYETAAERAAGRPIEASAPGLTAALTVAMQNLAKSDEVQAVRASTEEAEWARNNSDGSVDTGLVDALTEAASALLGLIDREARP